MVHLGKLLYSGKYAEIYASGKKQAVKLFYADHGASGAEYESQAIDKIVASGQRTAFSSGVVKLDGRYGIVLERIAGKNLLQALMYSPWKAKRFGRALARLHFSLHSKPVPNLQDQSLHLPVKIELAHALLGDRCQPIIEYLHSLPNGNSLCHGDLHPQNVMVSADGLMAIDWNDAYTGNSLGDVARTYLLLKSPALPLKIPGIGWLARKVKERLCEAYVAEYLTISGCVWHDIENWLLPLAAARLSEEMQAEEQEWLLEIIDKTKHTIQL